MAAMTITTEQRDLRDRIAAIPGRVAAGARASSGEPPAPDEWTASDILRHLIIVDDEVWLPRLRQAQADDGPYWPDLVRVQWSGEPGAGQERLLEVFSGLRGELVELLDGLDDAGWARWGTHYKHGRLDVAGLLEVILEHDDEHVAAVEALPRA
jgi:hypothetical protein